MTLFTSVDHLGAPAGRSSPVRQPGDTLGALLGLDYGLRFGL